ncbi:MAG TPA: MASE2 domain-containing protein [Terriglobales bacterium]|nr:MASE2 domain-containing protein [Terriglobales bacterium]
MSTPSGVLDAEVGGAARADAGPGRHVRYFYFIRTVTVLGALGVAVAHVAGSGRFDAYHAAIFALALVYPHLCYFLEAKLELGRRIEHATLIVDAFVGGSFVYLLGFAPLPSVALVLITLINPVAFTGFAMIGWTTLSLVLAIAVPWWVRGPNVAGESSALIDLAAVVYLFAYYLLFAHAVYLRTIALQKSRRELRQQGITLEIEKKRSDSLLLSILSPRNAAEFRRRGFVAPRRAASAALVHVAFPSLAAEPGADPVQLLERAAELARALDAICGRHGLEGVKSVGHAYVAIAGLDGDAAAASRAAIAAAREIARYVRELNVGHVARGEPPLRASVVAHAGEVVAGVLETRKVSYEVLGAALVEAAELARTAPEGVACASAAACAAAGVAPEPPAGALRTLEP